jgi:hypothetical protein
MLVVSQFHAPGLLRPKERSIHLIWKQWNRDKCLALTGNRTPGVQPVACRYTERAIPAPLSAINITAILFKKEANLAENYFSDVLTKTFCAILLNVFNDNIQLLILG